MNPTPTYQISRRDFGFIVARVISLLAALKGTPMLISAIATGIESRRTVPWPLLSSTIESVAIAVVILFVAAQLWVRADRFGRLPEDPPVTEKVSLTRNSLLQGIALGAAIWLLLPEAIRLATTLYWIISPKVDRGVNPLTAVYWPSEGPRLFYGILMCVLGFWGSRKHELTAPDTAESGS